MPISEPCLTRSLVKLPSLKIPFMESLAERCPVPRAPLHSSFKVPSVRAPPPDSRFPSDLKGPPWRKMLISTAFLTHIFWGPLRSKGVPHGERCLYPQPFLHISSRVPSDLKGSPMERDACIHILSYTYLLGSPVKELPSPPGPLHRASSERNAPSVESTLHIPYPLTKVIQE